MSAVAATKTKSSRRIVQGKVISNKMQKTIVVEITSMIKHPKYGKYYKKYAKLKAHDEKNECKVGDVIEIIESSPISKEKRFRVQKIIERAKTAGVETIEDQV